jgi:putative inorganic carbon (HCO3(-)) transporter
LVLPKRFVEISLPLIGIGVAALWPLTAYELNPLLFPMLLVLGGVILAVLTRPEFGLALALALLPLIGLDIQGSPAANIPMPPEPFRVLIPLIVFAVLIYGALSQGLDRRSLPGVFAGIALLTAAALASTLQAIEPSKGAPDVFLLVTGGALFLAIFNLCREWNQVLIVVVGALIALLIASVQGIGQHFSGVFSTQGFVAGGEVEGRIQGSFTHPNEYASFLALLIPLAVAVAFAPEFPARLRLLAGTAAAAAVPAIMYTYSRSVIVVLIIGSLLWLTFLRPRLAVKVAAVLGIVTLTLAPGTLKERLDPESTGADVPLREDIADSALRIYSDGPLLGVGIGNFPVAYTERAFTEGGSQKRLLHHQQLLVPTAAPSQYLNTMAEQGLIGLAALAAFVLLAIRSAYRVCKARDPAVRALGLGIGMSVLTFVLYVTVAVPMQETAALLLFALLALAASAERSTRILRGGGVESRPA